MFKKSGQLPLQEEDLRGHIRGYQTQRTIYNTRESAAASAANYGSWKWGIVGGLCGTGGGFLIGAGTGFACGGPAGAAIGGILGASTGAYAGSQPSVNAGNYYSSQQDYLTRRIEDVNSELATLTPADYGAIGNGSTRWRPRFSLYRQETRWKGLVGVYEYEIPCDCEGVPLPFNDFQGAKDWYRDNDVMRIMK